MRYSGRKAYQVCLHTDRSLALVFQSHLSSLLQAILEHIQARSLLISLCQLDKFWALWFISHHQGTIFFFLGLGTVSINWEEFNRYCSGPFQFSLYSFLKPAGCTLLYAHAESLCKTSVLFCILEIIILILAS